MALDPEQVAFINRRRSILRLWPFLAGFVWLLLLAVGGWLSLRHPLLINPMEVQRRLAAGTLDGSMAVLMAGMMPLTLDVCLFVTAIALLFATVGFRNERRLIRILDDVTDGGTRTGRR